MKYSEILGSFKAIDLSEMRPSGFHKSFADKIEKSIVEVDQGKGWQEVLVCPVCGSPERSKALERFGIEILCCPGCGLLYSSRIPRNPSDIYSGIEYLSRSQESYVKNMEFRKKRFGLERIGIILGQLGRQRGDGLRLLDLGCGTGWFLELAQETGFEVAGLELGDELRHWTETRLGVKLWGVELSELPPVESFDVITMFDLIEHVPNPVHCLRCAREHLRPGGLILVFTPNSDSLGFHVLGAEASLVCPAEHLVYFSPDSFRRAAEMVGLRILALETKGMDIADLAAREETENPEVADYLRSNFPLLQSIVDEAGCANHMRVLLTHSAEV